ncbi:MAG: hypothetical protein PHZ11_00815 [Desulfitobacteriaceae bacterium]|nr:hypothetical protein [Desulfitobacteriaceae bacterium]MDD4345434.1 hypothetical protein [Desulfitobacteriaceae bacterium]MDD4400719.1 hypothetical protein [Desulfitobacteriaceae bacterium]
MIKYGKNKRLFKYYTTIWFASNDKIIKNTRVLYDLPDIKYAFDKPVLKAIDGDKLVIAEDAGTAMG